MGLFSVVVFLYGIIGVASQCAIDSSFTIYSEQRSDMNGCYEYTQMDTFGSLSFPRYNDGANQLFVDYSITSRLGNGYLYYIGYADFSSGSVEPATCWSSSSFWTAYDYIEDLNDDGWNSCLDGGDAGEITITCGCGVSPDPIEVDDDVEVDDDIDDDIEVDDDVALPDGISSALNSVYTTLHFVAYVNILMIFILI